MNREELVNTILELSSDEVTIQLMETIAKEDYKTLVKRLSILAMYYMNKSNEI